MPPKGRNKPTPMVMFMNEMRDVMEKEHGKKFSVPFDERLYTLCKPLYDALDEAGKQRYKDLAKTEWTGIRDDKNKKYTASGKSVAAIEQEEKDRKLKKHLEFTEIEKQFDCDIQKILPMEIVVIHVNWFCKVDDNCFVPAEVALAKFSLQEGLIDTYHCFPYFEFPPGTKGDSKVHSDRTHQIPIFGFSEKLWKWPEIFQQVMKFLTKSSTSLLEGACYPLYTMDDNVLDITSRSAVRCFLNDIVSAANYDYDDTRRDDPHEKYFKLYDLSRLMYELKKKDKNDKSHIDEIIMATFLRKTNFLQCPKVACKWHDERDLIPKCSLTRCISWVYMACDHLRFMEYKMIPGKHLPHEVTVEDEASNRHSAYYADDEHYGYEGELNDYAENEFDDTASVASSVYYERDFPAQMSNLNLRRNPY